MERNHAAAFMYPMAMSSRTAATMISSDGAQVCSEGPSSCSVQERPRLSPIRVVSSALLDTADQVPRTCTGNCWTRPPTGYPISPLPVSVESPAHTAVTFQAQHLTSDTRTPFRHLQHAQGATAVMEAGILAQLPADNALLVRASILADKNPRDGPAAHCLTRWRW